LTDPVGVLAEEEIIALRVTLLASSAGLADEVNSIEGIPWMPVPLTPTLCVTALPLR
jgi:hypothetical protein